MKRNKHHGLNVEFDGLCMDFGHVSLNKKKEFLCGDCYKIEENDEDTMLVISLKKRNFRQPRNKGHSK